MSEMNGDRGRRSGARGPDDADPQALADVDRELRAALLITPSAGFEARVLRRIEGDRPVRSGVFGVARSGVFSAGRGLRTAALPAAASIVLVAGLFYALARTPAVDPQSPSQVVLHRAPAANPPQVGAPVANDGPVSPAVVPVQAAAERTQRLTARSQEPAVIVPLNQMDAVRRLVRAVNEGRVGAPAETPQGPMAPPAELAIAPLVVEPIPIHALDPDPGGSSPEIRRSY